MKNRKVILVIIMSFLAVLLFFNIVLIQNKDTSLIIEAFPIEICHNDNNIYFIGKIFNCNSSSTYNIYKLNKNDYKIEIMHLPELDEKFCPKKITFWNGNLYIILSKINNESQYEVWTINDAEAKFVYDLSKNVNFTINAIISFCIDKNGIYYLRFASETILIEPVSGYSIRFPDCDENVSFESMAVGKNGNVYVLFCKNLKAGGGYEVVEFSNGKMNSIFSGDLLPYHDIYSVLGTGNNGYDIFIKGTKSVYGFSKDKQKAEYISQLSLDEYQYTKSCFMDGETLLIWGMNPKNKNGKIINHTKLLVIDLHKKETAR